MPRRNPFLFIRNEINYFLTNPITIRDSARIPKVSNNNSDLAAKNKVKISGGVE
jgi:hypothetical protein